MDSKLKDNLGAKERYIFAKTYDPKVSIDTIVQ